MESDVSSFCAACPQALRPPYWPMLTLRVHVCSSLLLCDRFFWNFKTEKGAPQWDYMMGVREGWIPKDLDHRQVKC